MNQYSFTFNCLSPPDKWIQFLLALPKLRRYTWTCLGSHKINFFLNNGSLNRKSFRKFRKSLFFTLFVGVLCYKVMKFQDWLLLFPGLPPQVARTTKINLLKYFLFKIFLANSKREKKTVFGWKTQFATSDTICHVS